MASWGLTHVDFADGPTGGVIALDLIVNRSTLPQSIERFQSWVTQIFPLPEHRYLPCLRTLRNLLTWFFRDSKYPSHVVDTVMQLAFGQKNRLFGVPGQPWSGQKLGIMATTASSSQLRIFSNYNGSPECGRDKGVLYTVHSETRTDM